jgi:hypothetical protein
MNSKLKAFLISKYKKNELSASEKCLSLPVLIGSSRLMIIINFE